MRELEREQLTLLTVCVLYCEVTVQRFPMPNSVVKELLYHSIWYLNPLHGQDFQAYCNITPAHCRVSQYVPRYISTYQCGIHTRSAGSVVIDIHRSNEQYHMKSHCMIQLKHTGLCTNIVSIMCTATLPTGVHGTVNYHQIPCDFCLQFHHQFQPAGHSLRQIHRPTANIELHDCHTAMLICWHIFSVIS